MMNVIRETIKAIRITLVLWVLVAVLYPAIVLAVGQIAFSYQANGSLLKNAQGQVIGSALIGQPFTSDRYFNSRPSTIHYSTANPQEDTTGILKTGVSGASNLAPSNPTLIDRIQGKSNPDPQESITGEIAKLQAVGIQPTADLVYTSGSGLDPHITIDAAQAQIDRIAKVRGVEPRQLEILIAQNTDGRFLGIFGEPSVNAFKLNLALDALKP
jgi:potassium-transporting ATPase KdpC subunit